MLEYERYGPGRVVGAAGLLSACGGSKSNNAGSTAASGVEAPNSTGANRHSPV